MNSSQENDRQELTGDEPNHMRTRGKLEYKAKCVVEQRSRLSGDDALQQFLQAEIHTDVESERLLHLRFKRKVLLEVDVRVAALVECHQEQSHQCHHFSRPTTNSSTVSTLKKDDLLKLCQQIIIPKELHGWFQSFPTSHGTKDRALGLSAGLDDDDD
ncbi:hypothetical protein PoB_004549400 [Plakobranchus ocellatus]|uniref:Uncharacterized protein n=1 Tax=Plakobranchus ocellatus TaxID=259542 RepID=A0AAV4BKZ8_9GAST|nr:hypothetical protein PoB_004549400 [Plakobranchus ocellatus]